MRASRRRGEGREQTDTKWGISKIHTTAQSADRLKPTMYLLSYNVHTPDRAVYLSDLTYLNSTKCVSRLKEVFHFDLYP